MEAPLPRSNSSTVQLTLLVIVLAFLLVLLQTHVPKIRRKTSRDDSTAYTPSPVIVVTEQVRPPALTTDVTTGSDPTTLSPSADSTETSPPPTTSPPPSSSSSSSSGFYVPPAALLNLSSGDYWARGSWGRIVAVTPGCWVHPSVDSYAIECDEHVFGEKGDTSVRVRVEVVAILRVTDVQCRSCKIQQQSIGVVHWEPNKTRRYGQGSSSSSRDSFFSYPSAVKRLEKIPVEVETIVLEKGACNASLATFTGACVASFDFRVVVHDPNKFGKDAPEVCFVSIGDWGSPRPSMLSVAKLLEKVVSHRLVKFVLSTGDNFYPTGVQSLGDPQWLSTFEQPFRAAVLQNIRWYITAGNHDAWGLPAQREYMHEHARWHFPANYYAESVPLFRDTVKHSSETIELAVLFSAGREHMRDAVMSNHFYDTVTSRHGGVEQDASRHWRVVSNHEPMYSGGMHGIAPRQQQLRNLYLPYIQRNKIHMYVNGDDHMLEVHRSKGTDFFVSGAGGGSAFYGTSPMPKTVQWQLLHPPEEYFGIMLHCFRGGLLETTLLNTKEEVMYVHRTSFDVNVADFE